MLIYKDCKGMIGNTTGLTVNQGCRQVSTDSCMLESKRPSLEGKKFTLDS
jgi:hypothetical protein